MKVKILFFAALLAAVGLGGYELYAHCQIPCGIYDDPARFKTLEEHCTTIEKSMKEIEKLSKADEPNWNQIVRWTKNKEHHADDLTHIVTYYFMAQRVKPADRAKGDAYSEYVEKVTLLHKMVVLSMKAKQTTDLAHVHGLREAISQFHALYFGEGAGKK